MKNSMKMSQKIKNRAATLASVAQWIDHLPASWRIAGSIPNQDTCLGCGWGAQLGAWEKQPIDVSLACFPPSLSQSLPLPLKVNKYNL